MQVLVLFPHRQSGGIFVDQVVILLQKSANVDVSSRCEDGSFGASVSFLTRSRIWSVVLSVISQLLPVVVHLQPLFVLAGRERHSMALAA